MKNRFLFTVSVACLLLGGKSAQAQNATLKIAGTSEMTITGTSTLHAWKCRVTQINGTVSISEKVLKKGTLSKGDKIAAVLVNVPVAGIKSERGETMEQKMYNALKYEANPEVTFKLTDNQITAIGKESFSIEAGGSLTIAGKTNAVKIPVSGNKDAAGRYTFQGSYKLNMKDYEMEPPTAMFGQIVTGEEVEISFKIITEK